jgi:hypothetical protein
VTPIRKACLDEASKMWAEQPSLGMLEIANEIRVAIRGSRAYALKEIPGAEAIRLWLAEAIDAGEISGPFMGKQRKAKFAKKP